MSELELSKIANSTELSLIDLIKVKNEALHYLTLILGQTFSIPTRSLSLASIIRFPVVVFWGRRVLEVGYFEVDKF